MPLPVAHGLIGAGLVAATRRGFSLRRDAGPMLIGATLGMAPDLDLVLSWGLGFGTGVHGGFTHSLVLALAAGAGVSLLTSERSTLRVIAYIAAGASHGLLDACTKREFGGAALFWPISGHKYRFGLLSNYEFYPNPASQTWREIINQAAVFGLKEFVRVAPAVILIILIKIIIDRLTDKELKIGTDPQ